MIVCPGLTEKVKKGDEISLDIETGEIRTDSGELLGTAEPVSEYSMNILSHGGIKGMLKEQFKSFSS